MFTFALRLDYDTEGISRPRRESHETTVLLLPSSLNKLHRCTTTCQASSLRGVDVVAEVKEIVKGILPPFDQGTVGINVKSLGAVKVISGAYAVLMD